MISIWRNPRKIFQNPLKSAFGSALFIFIIWEQKNDNNSQQMVGNLDRVKIKLYNWKTFPKSLPEFLFTHSLTIFTFVNSWKITISTWSSLLSPCKTRATVGVQKYFITKNIWLIKPNTNDFSFYANDNCQHEAEMRRALLTSDGKSQYERRLLF